MGWSIGYDFKWKRDVGYGVPAICDYPGCNKEIDRGLSYVCGGEPYGGDHGCGLYFCPEHLKLNDGGIQVCERCLAGSGDEPFEPTMDTVEWMCWKLRDASWERWRAENPDEVENIRAKLMASAKAVLIGDGCEG